MDTSEAFKMWVSGWVDAIKKWILVYGACYAISFLLSIYASFTGSSMLDAGATQEYRQMLEEREAQARSDAEPWAMPSQKERHHDTKKTK